MSICLVANGGREQVIFRLLVRGFLATPHTSSQSLWLVYKLKEFKLYLHTFLTDLDALRNWHTNCHIDVLQVMSNNYCARKFW